MNSGRSKEETLRRHLWCDISRAFGGRPPADLSSADLLDIVRKLRLEKVIYSSDFKKLAEMQSATSDGEKTEISDSCT